MSTNEQTIDGGGAAFPYDVMQSGMSLRDWFAGQALVGLISTTFESGCTCVHTACACYEYADAMITARKETK